MDKNNKNQVKYNTKKVVLLVIFCLAVTIFVLTMIFSLGDIKSIGEAIKTVDLKYLSFATLLLIAYFLLYPLTLCILFKSKKVNIKGKYTYLIGSTEHFFNGITPFATGGQPFQVYAFKQMGVKASDSTGILVMNFIIHMLVTNLYALISLFYYHKLSETISGLLAMVIIGFAINFFVLLFMISIATSRRLRHGLESIMVWLGKFKHLKKLVEPNIPKFNDYCYQTQAAFKELWAHKGAFASCFIVRFVTMGIYYAITFFVLKALVPTVGADQLPFIIFSTAFAITMCVFVPTPGSSGGIEFAFQAIFKALAIAGGLTLIEGTNAAEEITALATSGMMIWRALTYYLVMFISFVIYIILQQAIVRRVKKEEALALASEENEDIVKDEDVNIDNNLNEPSIEIAVSDEDANDEDNDNEPILEKKADENPDDMPTLEKEDVTKVDDDLDSNQTLKEDKSTTIKEEN